MRNNLLLSIMLALLAVVVFDAPVQALDSQDTQIVATFDSFQAPANLTVMINTLLTVPNQLQDAVAVVQHLSYTKPVAGLLEIDRQTHNVFTVVRLVSTFATSPMEVELTRMYSNRAQVR